MAENTRSASSNDPSGRSEASAASARPVPLPQLRPYQLPPSEQKARDEKEAAERQERIKELQREAEGKPKTGRRVLRFFGWLLIIVVLTGGLGLAGWYYFLRQPMQEINNEAAARQQADTPPPPAPAAQTKHYSSTNFSLEFDYPQNWTVTDNSVKLTTVATPMKLKTAAAGQQTVQATVTIQPKQASLLAFKAGNATAVRESEKITYTKPSSVQRASSFISFLSYAGSAQQGLDGVYVTGDNGYKVDQAIPQVDIAKADPLITVTFSTCSDAQCTTPGKAVTMDPSVWDDASFMKPVKDLLQSLVVQ